MIRTSWTRAASISQLPRSDALAPHRQRSLSTRSLPSTHPALVDPFQALAEMPIIRFQSRQCAHLPAASCRCYIHPPAQRPYQIPIAPAAPPVPNFPRLRALALFGRRSPPRVEGFVMPASKNLHRIGLMRRNIQPSRAEDRRSDSGEQTYGSHASSMREL